MANFDQAIQIVLKNEGGYVNDPMDAGGLTKYGICKRDNPKLDIKNLTEQQAIAYYEKNWWNKFGFGTITNDAIACYLFDHSINVGVVPMTKIIQTVIQDKLQAAGVFGGITIDGILGPATIKLINEHLNKDSLLSIMNGLWTHYERIMAANPKDEKYRYDWHSRCFRNI